MSSSPFFFTQEANELNTPIQKFSNNSNTDDDANVFTFSGVTLADTVTISPQESANISSPIQQQQQQRQQQDDFEFEDDDCVVKVTKPTTTVNPTIQTTSQPEPSPVNSLAAASQGSIQSTPGSAIISSFATLGAKPRRPLLTRQRPGLASQLTPAAAQPSMTPAIATPIPPSPLNAENNNMKLETTANPINDNNNNNNSTHNNDKITSVDVVVNSLQEDDASETASRAESAPTFGTRLEGINTPAPLAVSAESPQNSTTTTTAPKPTFGSGSMTPGAEIISAFSSIEGLKPRRQPIVNRFRQASQPPATTTAHEATTTTESSTTSHATPPASQAVQKTTEPEAPAAAPTTTTTSTITPANGFSFASFAPQNKSTTPAPTTTTPVQPLFGGFSAPAFGSTTSKTEPTTAPAFGVSSFGTPAFSNTTSQQTAAPQTLSFGFTPTTTPAFGGFGAFASNTSGNNNMLSFGSVAANPFNNNTPATSTPKAEEESQTKQSEQPKQEEEPKKEEENEQKQEHESDAEEANPLVDVPITPEPTTATTTPSTAEEKNDTNNNNNNNNDTGNNNDESDEFEDDPCFVTPAKSKLIKQSSNDSTATTSPQRNTSNTGSTSTPSHNEDDFDEDQCFLTPHKNITITTPTIINSATSEDDDNCFEDDACFVRTTPTKVNNVPTAVKNPSPPQPTITASTTDNTSKPDHVPSPGHTPAAGAGGAALLGSSRRPMLQNRFRKSGSGIDAVGVPSSLRALAAATAALSPVDTVPETQSGTPELNISTQSSPPSASSPTTTNQLNTSTNNTLNTSVALSSLPSPDTSVLEQAEAAQQQEQEDQLTPLSFATARSSSLNSTISTSPLDASYDATVQKDNDNNTVKFVKTNKNNNVIQKKSKLYKKNDAEDLATRELLNNITSRYQKYEEDICNHIQHSGKEMESLADRFEEQYNKHCDLQTKAWDAQQEIINSFTSTPEHFKTIMCSSAIKRRPHLSAAYAEDERLTETHVQTVLTTLNTQRETQLKENQALTKTLQKYRQLTAECESIALSLQQDRQQQQKQKELRQQQFIKNTNSNDLESYIPISSSNDSMGGSTLSVDNSADMVFSTPQKKTRTFDAQGAGVESFDDFAHNAGSSPNRTYTPVQQQQQQQPSNNIGIIHESPTHRSQQQLLELKPSRQLLPSRRRSAAARDNLDPNVAAADPNGAFAQAFAPKNPPPTKPVPPSPQHLSSNDINNNSSNDSDNMFEPDPCFVVTTAIPAQRPTLVPKAPQAPQPPVPQQDDDDDDNMFEPDPCFVKSTPAQQQQRPQQQDNYDDENIFEDDPCIVINTNVYPPTPPPGNGNFHFFGSYGQHIEPPHAYNPMYDSILESHEFTPSNYQPHQKIIHVSPSSDEEDFEDLQEMLRNQSSNTSSTDGEQQQQQQVFNGMEMYKQFVRQNSQDSTSSAASATKKDNSNNNNNNSGEDSGSVTDSPPPPPRRPDQRKKKQTRRRVHFTQSSAKPVLRLKVLSYAKQSYEDIEFIRDHFPDVDGEEQTQIPTSDEEAQYYAQLDNNPDEPFNSTPKYAPETWQKTRWNQINYLFYLDQYHEREEFERQYERQQHILMQYQSQRDPNKPPTKRQRRAAAQIARLDAQRNGDNDALQAAEMKLAELGEDDGNDDDDDDDEHLEYPTEAQPPILIPTIHDSSFEQPKFDPQDTDPNHHNVEIKSVGNISVVSSLRSIVDSIPAEAVRAVTAEEANELWQCYPRQQHPYVDEYGQPMYPDAGDYDNYQYQPSNILSFPPPPTPPQDLDYQKLMDEATKLFAPASPTASLSPTASGSIVPLQTAPPEDEIDVNEHLSKLSKYFNE